ncbi:MULTISPECIES: sulfur carrier protein ThiS [unclassified Campylobacter]|uniref:sulfur carrier protein ThiS n=1 Tax=unclassified Campylobacter TaxID=2593542 RepID=UPI001237F72C|nr:MULTISPECIES: sulfur carrier protein ThiS [unclassified Campylobacter]KAA6224679.1 sulfur carrier protein ThiS [Campylobacter sp. LR185c]KAA6225679.1 sulfur carrier protein ThiS [Campylobacter sp. LR286c]KAA6225798.1 sulfur carrier protein ThiS [Campylobacter sp. LR196d]KAA6229652.1 sulfur carrier protein ThiS [Campylobacter sp. LR291e]KAA6230103.1 sulfur carrier protein ThiS [Campylobacter sp. LR264d]
MIINGEKLDFKELKFVDFLAQRGLKEEFVALELNGKIIKKDEFKDLVFKEGDRAEVVHFVGGG